MASLTSSPSPSPTLTNISDWVRNYLTAASDPRNTSPVSRRALIEIAFGLREYLQILWHSKTLGLTPETNGTDTQYYQGLNSTQLQIITPIIQLFSKSLEKASGGTILLQPKPVAFSNSSNNINIMSFEPDSRFLEHSQEKYIGRFYYPTQSRVTPIIGILKQLFNSNPDDARELLSTTFHELMHFFSVSHPHELKFFATMPEGIKELWCYHKNAFSWLTYEDNCTAKVLKPNPKFPDDLALKSAIEQYALGENYNSSIPELGCVDAAVIAYSVASPDDKQASINKLSHIFFKMQTDLGNLLTEPHPDKNFTSQRTRSNNEQLIRQAASSFAINLVETLLKSFALHEENDTKTKNLTIHYVIPFLTALIEFGFFSITKNITTKDLIMHSVLTLGPRVFETTSVQFLGRVVPSCLPTLRQYHGYLGLGLVAYSFRNNWTTLYQFSTGFIAGHLGKMCAYAIIKAAQKHDWSLSHPDPEDTMPSANTSSPDNTATHELGQMGHWIKSIESTATQIDQTITKWVRRTWGLEPMYALFLPKTEPSQTAAPNQTIPV